LETHPGLSFLANTPEFQDRYLETVLVRIFYNTPKGFTGKMSLTQLRKSGFLQGLTFIDTETDINKSIDFFSYEHFYVVYCKFWELDTDHDLIISADDLMRYSGGAPTRRIAERICSTPMFPRNPDMAKLLASKIRRQRGPNANKKAIVGLMTYEDFVWFILSEEDRDSSTALEYWFRMIDVDEDGYWSSFELEYFYTDMMPYLRDLGMEPPPFEDLLCQWLDMLSPHYSYNTTLWDCPTVAISLADLKRSKLGKAILHSLVSPSKFLALETKDPFADPAGKDGASDWLRFAQVEYELAVADQAGGGLDQSDMQSGEEE
jgi:serine/threonine-protein phosphatase 2A regulatory subunit B''